MATPTYTKTGAKAAASAKLDQSIFAVDVLNHELLKLAYNAYLANGRKNLAVAKNRGDVSGGGKKPWRQKGTGRARVGDNRVPQWRGGGAVFGPTGEENYTMTIPLRAKRQALRQALSLAATAGNIRVIEGMESKDGKAGKMAELLAKVDAAGRTLIVVGKKDNMTLRAVQNLPKVSIISATYLNVFELLNADTIVFDQDALKVISEWLATPAKTAAKGEKG